MDDAVCLRDVRKAFGATTAVDGMSLDVPRGGLYGFIGPSGAGKTTCIRMIMSILFPDSGQLSVLGQTSALRAKALSTPDARAHADHEIDARQVATDDSRFRSSRP